MIANATRAFEQTRLTIAVAAVLMVTGAQAGAPDSRIVASLCRNPLP